MYVLCVLGNAVLVVTEKPRVARLQQPFMSKALRLYENSQMCTGDNTKLTVTPAGRA